jgi:hypothetical protein
VITENQVFTQADKYNEQTRKRHLLNEINRSFANHAVLMQAIRDGRAVDVKYLPKVNKPILLIASGPSLDDAAPLLKKWKGDIMTSTSQATTCMYHGKDPKYIVALDPQSNEEELQADMWYNRDITLLLHPGVTNGLVSMWPNRMGLFRKMEPMTPFYGNSQKVGYSKLEQKDAVTIRIDFLIPTEIVMLGCVVNAQIFLAELLGYSPIYLVGCDMGYPEGQGRFIRWDFKDGEWRVSNPGHFTIEQANMLMSDNGVLTSYMMLFYKKNYMSALRLSKTPIINTSDKSIIKDTETPYIPFSEVLKKQGRIEAPWDIEKQHFIASAYMAAHHTFVIEFRDNAIQFTEFEKGALDIPEYINHLIKRGIVDVDYNKTIATIKKIAEAGYLSNEETKAAKEWKFKSEEENMPKERQKKGEKIENVEVYKAVPKAADNMEVKAIAEAVKDSGYVEKDGGTE